MISRLDLQVRDRRFVGDFALAAVVAVVVALPYAASGEPFAAVANIVLASALMLRRLLDWAGPKYFFGR